MLTWLAFLLGAGIFPPLLAWSVYLWWWRARLMRRVRDHACHGCGNSFEDAIVTWHGGPRSLPQVRLDQFQRRFAAGWVHCHDCDGYNLITVEGRPYRAWYRRLHA